MELSACRAIQAWLDRALRPVSCATARMAFVPPWHAGIGSSLFTFASFAMLAVEHGYAIYPTGVWKFARGSFPPTHEHFFEPLSTCSGEAHRRLNSGAVTNTRFTRARRWANSTFHGDHFVSLLSEGLQSVRLVTLESPKRGRPNPFPFRLSNVWHVLELARKHSWSFDEMFSLMLSRIMQPRPWLRAQLELLSLAPPAFAAAGGSFAPPFGAAVHIRGSEFTGDARVPIPLADYIKLMAQLPPSARRVIYLASDVPNITSQMELQMVDWPGGWKPRFVAGAGFGISLVLSTRDKSGQHPSAESAVSRLKTEEVRRVTTEALIDMYALAAATNYIGTASNWAQVVLLLRLAANRTHFGRSSRLSKFKRAFSGQTQIWHAAPCADRTATCNVVQWANSAF